MTLPEILCVCVCDLWSLRGFVVEEAEDLWVVFFPAFVLSLVTFEEWRNQSRAVNSYSCQIWSQVVSTDSSQVSLPGR